MYTNSFSPKCLNYGCYNKVSISRNHQNGSRSIRPFCSECRKADAKGKIRVGIKPFKTGRCQNINGRLGFSCCTNFDNMPPWAKGMTELHHIDQNRYNNDPSNIIELCSACHKLIHIKLRMENAAKNIVPSVNNPLFNDFFSVNTGGTELNPVPP